MSNLYEGGDIVCNVQRISYKENPSVIFHEGIVVEKLFRPGIWFWCKHFEEFYKKNCGVKFCAGYVNGKYFGC